MVYNTKSEYLNNFDWHQVIFSNFIYNKYLEDLPENTDISRAGEKVTIFMFNHQRLWFQTIFRKYA